MALVRHGKTGQFFTKIEAVRFYASSNRVKTKKNKPKSNSTGQRFDSVADSLSQRGYLRSTKSYSPPNNIAEEIGGICEKLNVSSSSATFTNNVEKFNFLAACFEAFEHNIPNSQLHEIQSVGDAVKFYQTPVDTTLPLDAIKTMDLPENLHIEYEYNRFNPETDTRFKGKSAFPKSSTIVTGLKYKDKYAGHVAKKSWP